MKILFLCGCLEIGQDGVGDYTRRLAGEVIRQGHECSIIAINDKLVSEVLWGKDKDENQVVETLRMPISLSWGSRMKLVQRWIHESNPDWVSLQYVPFAFQDKGLPFLLGSQLKKASNGRKWHIMFHELWVGDNAFKFQILGALQKKIVGNMIQKIGALVIHTHLPQYYNDLTQLSVQVRKLPLFSNFSEIPTLTNPNKGIIRVAFFNLVSEDSRITSFLLELYKKSVLRNLNFEILMIGGAIKRLRHFGNKLEELQEFKNRVKYTGFLTNELITLAINTCNVGVTPLRMSILGKSGTSAAFLSQGIPLAVPIVDGLEQPFFNDKLLEALLLEPDLDKLLLATKAAKSAKKVIRLSSVAETFINDLELNLN